MIKSNKDIKQKENGKKKNLKKSEIQVGKQLANFLFIFNKFQSIYKLLL